VICGGSALNCVQVVEDYALHCGLLPAYDVATCWVADSGVWYDFVVNGVVVGLVGCGVIGGPACLQPICQPFHEAWPHYCPPN
jgi:hypothetical protein